MKPYTVLDYYKWGKHGRYASKIGRALTDITFNKFGLEPLKNDKIQRNANPAWENLDLHAEVRMTAVPQSQGTGWHQDGDTTVSREEMDFAIVLWANRDPTQFKVPHTNYNTGQQCNCEDEIYQPEPFEVVIAKNLEAYHRRPPGLEGRRWHFRQRVVVPEWL